MMRILSASLRLLVGCFFIASVFDHATSGEHPSGRPEDDLGSAVQSPDMAEMSKLRVRVVDTDGKPISGASVVPYAMRTVGNSSGHYSWPRHVIGAPPAVTTDSDGVAEVPYPMRIGVATEPLAIRELTYIVLHDDHVAITMNSVVHGEQVLATMRRGSRVCISAVDTKGQPTEQFGVLFPEVDWSPRLWPLDGEGYRANGSIRSGSWQMMLVQPQPDGKTRFSDLTTIRVRENQTVRISKMVLREGARLEGRLSAEVPRPVRNGRVIATFAPKLAEQSYDDINPTLTWSDYAEVDEAGNFVIPSAPRGGVVQLIVLCDGWLSKTIDGPNRVQVFGQLFDVAGDVVTPEVQMEPTGVLEVFCCDEVGRPLAGISVSTWPNQIFLKGGSMVLGSAPRSLEQIEQQLLQVGSEWRSEFLLGNVIQGDYRCITNSDGIAVLTNLPLGFAEHLEIDSENYQLPKQDGGRRYLSYKLNDAQPQRMDVSLQKIQ